MLREIFKMVKSEMWELVFLWVWKFHERETSFKTLKVAYFVGDSGFPFSGLDLSYNFSLSRLQCWQVLWHMWETDRPMGSILYPFLDLNPLLCNFAPPPHCMCVCVCREGWRGGGILFHLLTLASVMRFLLAKGMIAKVRQAETQPCVSAFPLTLFSCFGSMPGLARWRTRPTEQS